MSGDLVLYRWNAGTNAGNRQQVFEEDALAGPIPENPNALLRRKATAEALTACGYPTAAASLATRVTRGGGPPYRLFGRIPLYRWSDALGWAEARLSPPLRSTAEADLRRRASSM